jgi:hypothetical protein
MDRQVLFKRAAAHVAARLGGAHSVEVWLAVLAAMSELGFDSEEKLSALTHAEVVSVVHLLETYSIPVEYQFVRKVAVDTLASEGGHFGPAPPRRGGEGGPGARTLSENGMAYIVDLLRWNGANGIGLRVADIRADIARDLGIDVSESTIRAVLKRTLGHSRTKGDSRCYRRWTPDDMEYEMTFCTWVFNTFVVTNQQYRLRFLDETGRESGETSSGYFWTPRGQPNRCAGPGPATKRYNIIGMTSCAPGRHGLPLTYAVFEGSLDGERFAEIVVGWIAFGCFVPGDVLVIDNAGVHLAGDVLEPLGQELAAHGVQLVRLPTYSPNLNPIELIWNTVKARLPVPRSSECAPAAFLPRLTEVLNTVSFNDIQNAMKHQSYFR